MTAVALEKLSTRDFQPLVGQEFEVARVEGGAPVATVTLTEAQEAGSAQNEGQRRPFSLIFEGPAATPFEQQILCFSNKSLGQMEIFIVPVGRAGDTIRYEALFN